ncbi:MAG: hypothetical protein KDA52_01870 [Planctomycetaceae bacterium]|nr:hypothetical protein [Planctomycetaceae bacterium]
MTAVLLKGSRVGDETVATLHETPNIEALDLSDTLVTDESLQIIGGMAQLRILFLDRSNVSGVDLSDLGKLTRLQYLGVTGLGLTEDARAELQRQLPEVSISDD